MIITMVLRQRPGRDGPGAVLVGRIIDVSNVVDVIYVTDVANVTNVTDVAYVANVADVIYVSYKLHT